MGVIKSATSTILKNSPIGGAYNVAKGIAGAFGIGKGADDKKYAQRLAQSRRLNDWASQGDEKAWVMLGAIGRQLVLPYELPAQYSIRMDAPVPRGWNSREWGQAYGKIIGRAAESYRRFAAGGGFQVVPGQGPTDITPTGGGPFSPGTAPAAAPPSYPPASPPTSTPSAPRVPAPPRACKYGRNPATGRCFTRREAERSAAGEIVSFKGGGKGPAPKPPCKYGPRVSREDPSVLDPAGVCPKPGSPHYRGSATGAPRGRQSAAMRRAQQTAEKVVYGGLTGAAKAIRAGWVASGLTAAEALTGAGLVMAAAAAGWLIGQQINKVISGESQQEEEMRAANDRRHARGALERELGRMPTLEEQKPITDAYNERLRRIRAGGFR